MTDSAGGRLSGRSFRRKAAWIVFIIGSILLACMLILVGALVLLSPGKPQPILGENGKPMPGSISEKIRVNINGAEQGMFIKSKDAKNPVLLYLHGGMPDYFLTQSYPTGLEDYFTVVWWEQRGSGMSYSPDIRREDMTLDLLVSDTIAVTNYLRARFGQDKIYLMGHSGGSFVGINAAAREPKLYHAYIGVAQMSYQLKSEMVAHEYMLEQFKAQGNASMVRKLEAAPVTLASGASPAYQVLRDVAMHSLGIGTMHEMKSVVTGIVLPSFFRNPEYTLGEKISTWRAKSMGGISVLWDEMSAMNLSQRVPELVIPVYFLEGAYDYTVNYGLARDYFESLKAPLKGFYTFERSAHSPMFEEPDKMGIIMREDVLAGRNSLADLR